MLYLPFLQHRPKHCWVNTPTQIVETPSFFDNNTRTFARDYREIVSFRISPSSPSPPHPPDESSAADSFREDSANWSFDRTTQAATTSARPGSPFSLAMLFSPPPVPVYFASGLCHTQAIVTQRQEHSDLSQRDVGGFTTHQRWEPRGGFSTSSSSWSATKPAGLCLSLLGPEYDHVRHQQ